MRNAYDSLIHMKFSRGFWLGYVIGAADLVIVWTLWAWRAELLDWWVS